MAEIVTQVLASDRLSVVVGLGASGLSAARFLARRGQRVVVMDSRMSPPQLDVLRDEFPEMEIHVGGFDPEILLAADELVMSPGIPLREPAIAEAMAAGVAITGDVGLFLREVTQPVIAITGSNAKSTVTELTGKMISDAGLKAGVGGNIGLPVLDMLDGAECDVYVLELSSFQLETLDQIGAEVATVLNVSPDHMDRYDDLPGYHRAKHRIFRGCRQVVVNRDDPLSQPLIPASVKQWSFGLGVPDFNQFGLRHDAGSDWLAFENRNLLRADELKIRGRHNLANALAALALGHAIGLSLESMVGTLRAFPGLPHRCQWVGEIGGVQYFNDSKGTNVGATVAAIEGLAPSLSGKLLLIAGGDGKGADFSDLADPCRESVRDAFLIGKDAACLAESLDNSCDLHLCESLEQAVKLAAEKAMPGDAVLLSPACASFDMFRGFEHRGDVFVSIVRDLEQNHVG